MTEVPEHLLQRSRARRAALGLGGDAGDLPVPAASATPAAATETESAPLVAAAAAPAPAPAARIEPIAPYVEAAVARKKIPFWAVPVLAFLPLWALFYAFTLDKPTPKVAGPVINGATVYTKCASCHGASGGGGVGPQLSGGNVLAQFPKAADQMRWVIEGSAGFKAKGILTYGTKKTSVDAGAMPSWSSLSAADLIGVIRHERETLSGEKITTQAQLNTEYDEILAMVTANYPARVAEFKTAIDGFKLLPITS